MRYTTEHLEMVAQKIDEVDDLVERTRGIAIAGDTAQQLVEAVLELLPRMTPRDGKAADDAKVVELLARSVRRLMQAAVHDGETTEVKRLVNAVVENVKAGRRS